MSRTNSTSNGTTKPTLDTVEQTADRLDAKLKGPLAPLETALDGVFGAKAAYQLPAEMKQLLVQIAPWLSLVSGVLGILSAISFWRAAHSLNQLSEALGIAEYVDVQLGPVFWLSIGMIVLFSVLAFLAFPGLRAQKKVGWNFMFYSMLANVVYGIVSLFYDRGGVGSFLAALVMSAIGFYILFQIRERYSSGRVAAKSKRSAA